MTILLILTAVVGLIVVLAAVAALIAWHPGHADPMPPWNGLDFCDCGAPAMFELAGSFTDHPDGGAAMVACYCPEHAPQGAVRV